jgi:hypothetical protein
MDSEAYYQKMIKEIIGNASAYELRLIYFYAKGLTQKEAK